MRDPLALGIDRGSDAMTDLTPDELIDTIVRSLEATAERFAPRNASVVIEAPDRKTDKPAPDRAGRARPAIG